MRTTIAAAAITAAASTVILTGCGNSAAEHAAQVKACIAAMTALIKHNYASVPAEPAACARLSDKEVAEITTKILTSQFPGASVSTSVSPSP
jgi:hypothetical protein